MYKEIILSVIKTSLPPMIVLIVLQYIFRRHSTYLFIEYSIAYSCVRMLPLINSMHTLGIKGILTLIVCFLFLNTSTLIMYRIHSLNPWQSINHTYFYLQIISNTMNSHKKRQLKWTENLKNCEKRVDINTQRVYYKQCKKCYDFLLS